jgi:hypothetical protein
VGVVLDGDFSLMRGGPTWRVLQPLARIPRVRPAWTLTLILLLLTVVPAAVLTWRAGTLLPGGVKIPLAADWFVIARLVFAMPLMVLAARFSDRMVGDAVRQFSISGIVDTATRPRFERILAGAIRARDGYSAELICVAAAWAPAFITSLAGAATDMGPAQGSYWRFDAAGAPTPAAVWIELVAAPLFRFILLLWLWRFLLWSWMLWRLSRLPLALRATHPDRACGLGFLGLAQSRFAVISATGALVVCGNSMNLMIYAGESILSFKYLIAAYAILSTAVLLGPLLLLSAALARTRRQDLARYDIMGQRLIQAFDAQWDAMPGTVMLDSPSPQTMADYSAIHDNIRGTTIVPVNRWHLVRMLGAGLVPFVPLLFIAMPLDELMARIVSVIV